MRALAVLIVFCLCVGISTAEEGAFELHLLNASFVKERGAFCLDGSAPGFYFRRGQGADANKFKIHLQVTEEPEGGWREKGGDGRRKNVELK